MRYALILTVGLAACSSTTQERISQDFEPILPQPVIEPADRLAQGAIWAPGERGLFVSHRRASRVGDVLTVDLAEGFQASNNRSVSTARDTNYSTQLPGVLDRVIEPGSLDASMGSGFNGSGTASQSNTLSGRMSVTVIRILPGGNLEIMGEKQLTMNSGDEYIRLHGIVRPEDISSDNVVMSDRIAQAEIQYVGAGDISDASRTGWLRRLISTVEPL